MPVYKQGSFPPAYGSRQDTRYTDVTQLDAETTERIDAEEEALLADVSECDVLDAFAGIRPASQMPGPAPYKQIFTIIHLPFTTGVRVDDRQYQIPFGAQSIRVDNYTPGWFFIPELKVFIIPDWYGAIFSTTGMKSVTLLYQAPGGIANVALTNINTSVFITAHSERLIDVAGTKRV